MKYKAGIDKIVIMDFDKIIELHPIDAMKQIDIVFNWMKNYTDDMRQKTKPKNKKPVKSFLWAEMWHDLYTEYGQWSHVFNKAIRKNIENFMNSKHPTNHWLSIRYKYVYAYWWNRFHYVDNIMKKRTKLWGKKAEKNLEKTRKALEGLIKGNINIKNLPLKFRTILEQLDKIGLANGHDQRFNDQ